MKTTAPYGQWRSPITPTMLAQSNIGLGLVGIDGDCVIWTELRPAEQGRMALMQASLQGTPPQERSSAAMSCRSRVHEYGGGAAAAHHGTIFMVNDSDQRIWKMSPQDPPLPLTRAENDRYADLQVSPDGRWIVAVREQHFAGDKEPEDQVVAISTTGGESCIIATGHDFFSSPRFSADGKQIAYLAWDHPSMPWDSSSLWVVSWDGQHPGPAQRVAGGAQVSVCQPVWSPAGVLTYCADDTGFWNLYQWRDGRTVVLTQEEMELARPPWSLGVETYGFMDEETIVAVATDRGVDSLFKLDVGQRTLTKIAVPWVGIDSLCVRGSQVALLGATVDRPSALVIVDLQKGTHVELARSLSVELHGEDLSAPEAISFPNPQGTTSYGFFYPPRNRHWQGDPLERPPLIVQCHGGPTAVSTKALRLATQFWTSHGFAVVDVNYGGSSGYGRAYRQRLHEAWGEVDLEDCCAAARYLVQQDRVDRERLLIRGGSAGGFTVLCAATFTDLFAAGASYYGIADLVLLTQDTHKLESHYLDQLVGQLPGAEEVYRQRSPIHHTTQLRTPLILFQGLEDRVVPPGQSRQMVAALRKQGIVYEYLELVGEGHGFRRAATIEKTYSAELAFYRHVLGISCR